MALSRPGQGSVKLLSKTDHLFARVCCGTLLAYIGTGLGSDHQNFADPCPVIFSDIPMFVLYKLGLMGFVSQTIYCRWFQAMQRPDSVRPCPVLLDNTKKNLERRQARDWQIRAAVLWPFSGR